MLTRAGPHSRRRTLRCDLATEAVKTSGSTSPFRARLIGGLHQPCRLDHAAKILFMKKTTREGLHGFLKLGQGEAEKRQANATKVVGANLDFAEPQESQSGVSSFMVLLMSMYVFIRSKLMF